MYRSAFTTYSFTTNMTTLSNSAVQHECFPCWSERYWVEGGEQTNLDHATMHVCTFLNIMICIWKYSRLKLMFSLVLHLMSFSSCSTCPHRCTSGNDSMLDTSVYVDHQHDFGWKTLQQLGILGHDSSLWWGSYLFLQWSELLGRWLHSVYLCSGLPVIENHLARHGDEAAFCRNHCFLKGDAGLEWINWWKLNKIKMVYVDK